MCFSYFLFQIFEIESVVQRLGCGRLAPAFKLIIMSLINFILPNTHSGNWLLLSPLPIEASAHHFEPMANQVLHVVVLKTKSRMLFSRR